MEQTVVQVAKMLTGVLLTLKSLILYMKIGKHLVPEIHFILNC